MCSIRRTSISRRQPVRCSSQLRSFPAAPGLTDASRGVTSVGRSACGPGGERPASCCVVGNVTWFSADATLSVETVRSHAERGNEGRGALRFQDLFGLALLEALIFHPNEFAVDIAFQPVHAARCGIPQAGLCHQVTSQLECAAVARAEERLVL